MHHYYGASNFISDHDDNMRPYDTDIYTHVPLGDTLTRWLTSDDPTDFVDHIAPVDWGQTYYNFSSNEWVIVHMPTPDENDHVANKIAEIQVSLDEAIIQSQIPDLPSSVLDRVNAYIAQLTALKATVNADNCATVIVPKELPI